MKAQRVLLIDPPFQRFFGQSLNQFPLGPTYLAAALDKAGIETAVLNTDYSPRLIEYISERKMIESYDDYLKILKTKNHPIWKEIESVIENWKPTIVGISVRTPKYYSALSVASIVKKINSKIPVIFGGVHATIAPELCIKNKDVDFVVRGEGEATIVDLIKNLSQKKLTKIKGLTFKNDQGKIIHNPDRELIENINDIPFPARHLMIYKSKDPEYYNIIFATRGCPHNCTFCASKKLWTRRVRFRKPENVVNEIEFVYKKYGIALFNFLDDSFVINPKYTNAICDEILKRNLKITWVCETPASSVTDKLIKKMKKAGCYSVMIGIESGNKEILEKIKKSSNKLEMKKAAKILKKNKIRFCSAFMIGFPWDTRETIQETVSFMKELDPDNAGLSIVVPYPGTELYEEYVKERFVPRDFRKLDFSYFNQVNPRMFNNNFSEEEKRKIVMEVVRVFDKHNRKKVLIGLITNTQMYLKILTTKGWFNPSRILKVLKFTLNLK